MDDGLLQRLRDRLQHPLVPRQLAPKSYDDPLDRKWKGKLLMEGTKADWFAGMLQILGPERGLKYMRELAKQQPSPREGHELLAQLVVAGEGFTTSIFPSLRWSA